MRILVTGHDGYVGNRLVPRLLRAGHDVVGLDSLLFRSCRFPSTAPLHDVPEVLLDVRDVDTSVFEGIDGVVHLAGISNDPVGDLNADCTAAINIRGTELVARAAKTAGVERFVFASSCSLYGAAGEDLLDESAAFNPVTPYGVSKVEGERVLTALADDDFSPTFLRFATAYGMSSRLRGDLVVNNLVGYAVTTGEVLLRSDGSPLRPLVHVDDMSSAIIGALEAPRDVVHAEAFNIGRTTENYRIRDVAELVQELVPGSKVSFMAGAGPDIRNYRVNCDKAAERIPGLDLCWTVRDGIEELRDAYLDAGLTVEDLTGPRLQRIAHLRELQQEARLDDMLRWLEVPVALEL